MIPESLSALASGLAFWRNHQNDTVQSQRRRQEAVGQVMVAVVATKAYLYDLDQGASLNRGREREISRSWQDVATAICEYDRELYQSAQLKALGWADPREWKRAQLRPDSIQLDTIIKQCQWLQEHG